MLVYYFPTVWPQPLSGPPTSYSAQSVRLKGPPPLCSASLPLLVHSYSVLSPSSPFGLSPLSFILPFLPLSGPGGSLTPSFQTWSRSAVHRWTEALSADSDRLRQRTFPLQSGERPEITCFIPSILPGSGHRIATYIAHSRRWPPNAHARPLNICWLHAHPLPTGPTERSRRRHARGLCTRWVLRTEYDGELKGFGNTDESLTEVFPISHLLCA